MNEAKRLQKLRQLDTELVKEENLSGAHKKKAWNLLVERKELVQDLNLENFTTYGHDDIALVGQWEYLISYVYRIVEGGVWYKARKKMLNGSLASEKNLFIENDEKPSHDDHERNSTQASFKKVAEDHGVTHEELAKALDIHLRNAVYVKKDAALNSRKSVLTSLSSVNNGVKGEEFLGVVRQIMAIKYPEKG